MRNFLLIVGVASLFCACTSNTGASTTEKTSDTTRVDSLTDSQAADVFKNAVGMSVAPTNVIQYQSIAAMGGAKIQPLVTPGKTPGAPTKIADLTSGTVTFVYKFNQNNSASASLFGFTGSISRNEMLFIEDYVRYKEFQDHDTTVRMGIGLRCFIHVKGKNSKASFSSLPKIAANVELDNAEAQYGLMTLGFGVDGSVLAPDFQTAGDYTVDNFGKLSITFNNVLKILNATNKDLVITPVKLPKTSPIQ